MNPALPVARLEALEPRTLLASSLGSDGTLNITGTSGNDKIEVGLDTASNRVRVIDNGVITRYVATSVKLVKATLGSGDDRLEGALAGKPLHVQGENGMDTIVAGVGNDSIYGGVHADSILGGAGNDSIAGGYGRDVLRGEKGNDRVEGDEDNDTLYGGDGNDSLMGGLGGDMYFGDAGDDVFNSAGTYIDNINGGLGNDSAWANRDDILTSIEVKLAAPPK